MGLTTPRTANGSPPAPAGSHAATRPSFPPKSTHFGPLFAAHVNAPTPRSAVCVASPQARGSNDLARPSAHAATIRSPLGEIATPVTARPLGHASAVHARRLYLGSHAATWPSSHPTTTTPPRASHAAARISESPSTPTTPSDSATCASGPARAAAAGAPDAAAIRAAIDTPPMVAAACEGTSPRVDANAPPTVTSPVGSVPRPSETSHARATPSDDAVKSLSGRSDGAHIADVADGSCAASRPRTTPRFALYACTPPSREPTRTVGTTSEKPSSEEAASGSTRKSRGGRRSARLVSWVLPVAPGRLAWRRSPSRASNTLTMESRPTVINDGFASDGDGEDANAAATVSTQCARANHARRTPAPSIRVSAEHATSVSESRPMESESTSGSVARAASSAVAIASFANRSRNAVFDFDFDFDFVFVSSSSSGIEIASSRSLADGSSVSANRATRFRARTAALIAISPPRDAGTEPSRAPDRESNDAGSQSSSRSTYVSCAFGIRGGCGAEKSFRGACPNSLICASAAARSAASSVSSRSNSAPWYVNG